MYVVDTDNGWFDANDGNHITNDVNPQSHPEITLYREHDWSQLENTYKNVYFDVLLERYK